MARKITIISIILTIFILSMACTKPMLEPLPQDTYSTPTQYTITNICFHDYNGNGQMDQGEPPIEGIEITYSPEDTTCISDTEGKGIINLEAGEYSIRINDSTKKFRYILPSVTEILPIENGLKIEINGDSEIYIPLAEGFLTLPYQQNTKYDIGEYFDYNRALFNYTYWNGESGGGQYQRNHVGVDFYVPANGITVVAPSPGEIIWLGKDPNGGYGIDVKTTVGYVYGAFHFDPDQSIKVGSIIKRGQLIGTVDFPNAPHIHINIYERRADGLFFIDTYKPEITSCTEYRLVKQGEVEGTQSKCSLGYWTVCNDPLYP